MRMRSSTTHWLVMTMGYQAKKLISEPLRHWQQRMWSITWNPRSTFPSYRFLGGHIVFHAFLKLIRNFGPLNTKLNYRYSDRNSYMSMYDLDVVSDVVPDVVPHLNGLPSKQFKARIRCGGAANYGPRITEYIAEYYGVFDTAQLKVNWK